MTPLCRLLALQLALGVAVAIAVYWALTLDDSDNSERVLVDTDNRSSRRPPGSALASEVPIDMTSFFAGVDLTISETEIAAALDALGLEEATITLEGRFGPPPVDHVLAPYRVSLYGPADGDPSPIPSIHRN